MRVFDILPLLIENVLADEFNNKRKTNCWRDASLFSLHCWVYRARLLRSKFQANTACFQRLSLYYFSLYVIFVNSVPISLP